MKKIYSLLLGLLFFSKVKAQIVTIPDANFKAKLLEASPESYIAQDFLGNLIKIDTNNDGEIQVSEAKSVMDLSVVDSNISSLEGISSFSNLERLQCQSNKITFLDVSGLVNLTYLDCRLNQLTSLNVLSCVKLDALFCLNNQLTSVDVSGLVNLSELDCSNNKLTSLDVTGLINLNDFKCSFNQLTSLDVSDNINLGNIIFNNNLLSSLDFSTNSHFQVLNWVEFGSNFNVSHNQLTSVIFPKSINRNDFKLDISYNLLETIEFPACYSQFYGSLKMENNPNLTFVLSKKMILEEFVGSFYQQLLIDFPNLKYICAADTDISIIEDIMLEMGITNCQVNSYCSFVPGGEYYTINGNVKLDNNINGCDVSDSNFPNLNFSITDGTITGSSIANTIGSYSIPVQAGTHTITPVLENPSYYSVSPEFVTVTFSPESTSFTQDFCIAPKNGVHPDLEVTILPILRARPGFDASYRIIYKNKGNQTQSGSVKLTFDDAVLDLVAANPVFTSQSIDNLSWDYIDLKPFETRVIEVTLNVNSPMEIPAVNIDDRLSFTALINPVTGDEQPVDNSFALRQLVVGSYDPNDKTCLEGTTIPPSAVGKYVHYIIRFENKGTAEAENVVIKDLIDTDKFDISSLIVTEGSHPFVTKISDTNKVEFIFEKINLPFEDATNDGYVAFKIKTKPSLVLGDSFSNTASIYFDYNFPIITNTATTSVLQSLGTQDFEFSSYFKVYPNPAKQLLNIDVKKNIAVSSISIFNTLGQQILVIPNAQMTKQVDVSSLKTGNYFIKVTSNKGSASEKFIKN
ncbi:DUF7619 domain-containing protein [Flavobacterium luteum]|uniref:T9SS type A sorting domain-containing protein n=1 Tax=Flavobacterium luteum TaxID=2026654 RepID=A0A7J5AKP1_9FLAO|nr:T9SS type A sorting domain-containing protein [Flavobacterium luteum]KAB1158073.1 T9SS type A sorting domain-containing protein [Flavobacterium luteum]